MPQILLSQAAALCHDLQYFTISYISILPNTCIESKRKNFRLIRHALLFRIRIRQEADSSLWQMNGFCVNAVLKGF